MQRWEEGGWVFGGGRGPGDLGGVSPSGPVRWAAITTKTRGLPWGCTEWEAQREGKWRQGGPGEAGIWERWSG